MMTNHSRGRMPQNNNLTAQRTQDWEDNIDGPDARAPTLIGTGLLLLPSRHKRSNDVSDQEAMNCIKNLLFQSMCSLLSVEALIKCF